MKQHFILFLIAVVLCFSTAIAEPLALEDSLSASLTFSDQCADAGITLIHEDPNAALYAFTSSDPDVDVVTHASGAPKYIDETDGPCIKTPLDLAERSQTKVKTYFWVEDDAGVSTLDEAAALPDARYVTYPFPNDGQKYIIDINSSAVGTNTICTVDETGWPSQAVFGMKYVAEDDGVYTSAAITSETATYRNIMAGSPILITYYEYNPHSEKKMGIGTRNAGARVYCEMDEDLSTVTIVDSEEKISVAEFKAIEGEKPEIKYLSLKAKVVELNSVG